VGCSVIVVEKIEINGIKYVLTYLDNGKYIEWDSVKYVEAIDTIGFDRIYVEAEEVIEIENIKGEI